jgi:hypothetical protein
MSQCVADDRGPCRAEAEPDSPLGLCPQHLLVAHDWVVRSVGMTDRLPSPCLACGSRLGVHYPSGWLCAICEWKVGDIPDFERGDRLVEQRRHAQFASHRIPRTEWFEQHEALLQHTSELRAGVDDPWAQYALWASRRVALL